MAQRLQIAKANYLTDDLGSGAPGAASSRCFSTSRISTSRSIDASDAASCASAG